MPQRFAVCLTIVFPANTRHVCLGQLQSRIRQLEFERMEHQDLIIDREELESAQAENNVRGPQVVA
jgi:hypothetical protein